MDLFSSLFGWKTSCRRSASSRPHGVRLTLEQLEGRLVLSPMLPSATVGVPIKNEVVATFGDGSPYDNANTLVATVKWANGQTTTGTIVALPLQVGEWPQGYEVLASDPVPPTTAGYFADAYVEVLGVYSTAKIAPTEANWALGQVVNPAPTPPGDTFTIVTPPAGQPTTDITDNSDPTGTPTTADSGTPGTGVTDPGTGTQLQAQLQQNAGTTNQGGTPGTGVTDPGTQLQGQLQQNAGTTTNQGANSGDAFNANSDNSGQTGTPTNTGVGTPGTGVTDPGTGGTNNVNTGSSGPLIADGGWQMLPDGQHSVDEHGNVFDMGGNQVGRQFGGKIHYNQPQGGSDPQPGFKIRSVTPDRTAPTNTREFGNDSGHSGSKQLTGTEPVDNAIDLPGQIQTILGNFFRGANTSAQTTPHASTSDVGTNANRGNHFAQTTGVGRSTTTYQGSNVDGQGFGSQSDRGINQSARGGFGFHR